MHSTTLNNTINNSISSIKVTKNTHTNSKNNLFNSFKQKTYVKEFAVNQKMYLYKKNNELTSHINNNTKGKGTNFPIDLLNKSNNRYTKYYNNKNNMNKHNYINNYIKNNTNKKSINKNNQINNNKNNNNNNKNNFIYFNSKNKNKKSIASLTNPNIISNTNNSVSYINTSKIGKLNKKNQIPQGANPINTYIINTLNVSEKEFLKTGISSAKQPKVPINDSRKDLQSEINKLMKEKEEQKNLIKKQKKLIEKLEEDNEQLEGRINSIIYENKKIKAKIETYTENQEQLIMLVKIVQKNGIDVEDLIDKWNAEVENMNNEEENEISDNKESISDEINELQGKIDPSSFIPINIEKPHVNKKVFNGIPKLNFSNINNKDKEKKAKFKNNSK